MCPIFVVFRASLIACRSRFSSSISSSTVQLRLWGVTTAFVVRQKPSVPAAPPEAPAAPDRPPSKSKGLRRAAHRRRRCRGSSSCATVHQLPSAMALADAEPVQHLQQRGAPSVTP